MLYSVFTFLWPDSTSQVFKWNTSGVIVSVVGIHFNFSQVWTVTIKTYGQEKIMHIKGQLLCKCISSEARLRNRPRTFIGWNMSSDGSMTVSKCILCVFPPCCRCSHLFPNLFLLGSFSSCRLFLHRLCLFFSVAMSRAATCHSVTSWGQASVSI